MLLELLAAAIVAPILMGGEKDSSDDTDSSSSNNYSDSYGANTADPYWSDSSDNSGQTTLSDFGDDD